jgi:hypothetical protein
MLPQVEQHFDVERIVLTPNETYVTLDLRKKGDTDCAEGGSVN